MENKNSLDLYTLTPLEFEQLILTLLAETGFTSLKVTDGPGDRGVDILGLRGDQKVAIQVKHKRDLSLSELQRFTDKYFSDPLTPRSLLYVTSAKIPQGAEKIAENLPKGCSLKFLDQKNM
jgi:restriction endonuclease Mrr